MRSRCVSLLPRTTLHSDSEHLPMKNPLTWNGSSLYVVVNPHPCRPLAQSQLPHLKSPYPAPVPTLFFPSSRQYMQQLYTDDINKPISSSVRHSTAYQWVQ
jgi:hypothetical protein